MIGEPSVPGWDGPAVQPIGRDTRRVQPDRVHFDQRSRGRCVPATGDPGTRCVHSIPHRPDNHPRRSLPCVLATGDRRSVLHYPASPRRSRRCPATGEPERFVTVHIDHRVINRRSTGCVLATGEPSGTKTVHNGRRRSPGCPATGDPEFVPRMPSEPKTRRRTRCAAVTGRPARTPDSPSVPTGILRGGQRWHAGVRRVPRVAAIGEPQRPPSSPPSTETSARPGGCPSTRATGSRRGRGPLVRNIAHRSRGVSRQPCRARVTVPRVTVPTVRPAPTVATPLRQAAPEWSTTLLGRVDYPTTAFATSAGPPIEGSGPSPTRGDDYALRTGLSHLRSRGGNRRSSP
ncbi:hypothetical protein JOD54_002594 [Actinokineospora baliensis]|nr:hypothetical protein [Actinokineospora baliensis]